MGSLFKNTAIPQKFNVPRRVSAAKSKQQSTGGGRSTFIAVGNAEIVAPRRAHAASTFYTAVVNSQIHAGVAEFNLVQNRRREDVSIRRYDLTRVTEFHARAEPRRWQLAGEEVATRVLLVIASVAEVSVIAVRKTMVNFDIKRVDALLVLARSEIIWVAGTAGIDLACCGRAVRKRIGVEYLLCDRAEIRPTGQIRNYVAREWCPCRKARGATCPGIDELHKLKRRKISVPCASGWHRILKRIRNTVALSEIVCEEERAVLDNRSAQHSAEFIDVGLGFWKLMFCAGGVTTWVDQVQPIAQNQRRGCVQGRILPIVRGQSVKTVAS